MTTPQEIAASIRAEHPAFVDSDNDRVYFISPEEFPEEYERMVAERVEWRIAELAQEDVRTTARAKRQQFVAGMAALRENLRALRNTSTVQPNWNTLTAAQKIEALRQTMIDATQADVWIGEILQDLGSIERDG